jgi:hypothetical protein
MHVYMQRTDIHCMLGNAITMHYLNNSILQASVDAYNM